MPVNLVSEDDLRAALRPYRTDPSTFEAAVRERLRVAQQQREDDPLANFSPLERKVAGLLPLEIITGSRITATPGELVPAAGGYKLLSYLAFPAICLFVLLGATVFSLAKIRTIQGANKSQLDGQQMMQAISQWWRCHKWGAMLVFGATLVMSLVGATWLLFLLYIISFGLLLYVLTSFAKLGLGNRQVIGQSCAMGLMFLAQTSMFPGVGDNDIHFVDQSLLSAVFWGGVLVLLLFSAGGSQMAVQPTGRVPRWLFAVVLLEILALLIVWFIYPIFTSILLVAAFLGGVLAFLLWFDYRLKTERLPIGWLRRPRMVGLLVAVGIPLLVWWVVATVSPVTPAQIKRYVESFDSAPFSTPNWRHWEIPARWAIDAKLDPDLSKPRRLLAREIAGGQNFFILGTALRVGLLQSDQLGQLRDYEQQRQFLLDDPHRVKEKQIIGLEQADWVIRAAVLRDDLSPKERDYLAKRLNVTMESLSKARYEVLESALRITELLDVIQRPIDRNRYRGQVHDMLRRSHSTVGGGFQLAGGFKRYLPLRVASLDSTSYAVQLMAVYGVPDDLDLDWVRSYLRTKFFRPGDEKWMAPVTLDRLNRMPGVTHPSWFRILYYERSLLAALVLVALCIYATLSSPKPKTLVAADRSLGT